MPPRSARSRRLLVIAGTLLSVWLLWFMIRKVDVEAFKSALREASPTMMLLAVATATLCFPLRIPRWRLLLPEPDQRPLRAQSLWHAITLGFTANTLMPVRLGEVVRAATVTRLERIAFPTTFASLAVERALDGIVVVAMFGIGLVTAELPPDVTTANGTPIGPIVAKAGLIALVATLLVLAAAWKPAATLRLFRRLVPRGPAGEKFLHFAEQVLTGLGALRDPARAIPVLGWSILIWTVNATSFWLGCLAFGIHIPFTASFVLQGLTVVGIAVPAAPGGLGTFELALIGALLLFGIDESLASAYALAFHLTTAIPIILLGLWSLRRVGGSLASAAETPPELSVTEPAAS